MVERQLPKLNAEGSIPFTRSTLRRPGMAVDGRFGAFFLRFAFRGFLSPSLLNLLDSARFCSRVHLLEY